MSVEDWARAEAEKKWPQYPAVGFSGPDDKRAAYVAGVSDLAERLQSPEVAEASTNAMHGSICTNYHVHEEHKRTVRAALAAALDAITKGDGK